MNPQRGERWQHHNGCIYVVLHISNTANVREDHPPDVVYATWVNMEIHEGPVCFGDGPAYDPRKIWTRPLSDWHRSFERL